MELQTLNSTAGSASIFQPVKVVENYQSLIWTERYWECGDFELVSSDITNIIKLLPLESYVTLRDTTVPMIVEQHKINKPKNGPATVTIKGRSFESVLERRASVDVVNTAAARIVWLLYADANKQSDAAYKAMRVVLGDIARSNLTAVSAANANDAIPQINLPLPTDYTTGTGTAYEIEAGNLYTVVMQLLKVNRHGMRAIRPTATSGKLTVDLEIYNGADLRNTAVFDARQGQFDDTTHLLSFQGSANVAYIYGPNGGTIRNKTTTVPSGLSRRVLLIDEQGDQIMNTVANREARALTELYKNNAVAIFDGEASTLSTKFNKPVAEGGYGLGDIVKFNGEYDLVRNMRVAEFIRSSDSTGVKAYPAFETIDE